MARRLKVQLSAYLDCSPDVCAAGDTDQPLSKEIAKELARTINPGAAGDRKIPLTWNQWQLAYPRFALEAELCGMVPYAVSMSHMVCQLIAEMFLKFVAYASGVLPKGGRNSKRRGWTPALAGDPVRRGQCSARARWPCPAPVALGVQKELG